MASNADFIDDLLQKGRPALSRSPKPIPGWQWGMFNSRGQEDLTHAGSPPSWNTLTVNGTKLPWLVRLSYIKHRLVKVSGRASGKGPGSPTVRGREPGVFGFQFKLRNNAEWESFVELAPKLLPVVAKTASQAEKLAGAVQIYYPMVAAFGIRWAVVDEIEGSGPDGGGPSIIKVAFEETQNPTNVKVAQAKPPTTGFEAAPIIEVAGQPPRPPNLRDLARKPVSGAR